MIFSNKCICYCLGLKNRDFSHFLPFLSLSTGQHYPHYCQSRHNLQEWAAQVQNQDHEWAGEQRCPDLPVPNRRRSRQRDQRLHERKFTLEMVDVVFVLFFIAHNYAELEDWVRFYWQNNPAISEKGW